MNDVNKLRYIPQELKMNALWCGWKLTDKGKIPFNVITDNHAKSNDESTFVSYPVLLHYIHKYLLDDGKTSGIGLGIFRGFSAVDIDHCVDENGNLSDMAKDIVDFCNSYTEYSPSGTGIRIIFKTSVKIDKEEYYINNHNNGLEIYISDNTSKFVTITGNKLSGDIINEVNIQPILDKYMKKNVFNLEKALEKDHKLNELWYSVAPGSHSNESELDMALCCKLAYYLKNDSAEIKKYFEMSPYYNSKDEAHKKKWSRGYAEGTIRGANNYVGPVMNNQLTTSHKQYELNDTGNARRFVERFDGDIKYNIDNCKWMLWNGKYWQIDVKDKIRDYVELLAEEMSIESNNEPDLNTRTRILRNIDNIYNSSGKNNLLKEAQHIGTIPVMNDDLDRDPYLLCCGNSVIDLRTGEEKGFDKSDMISQTTSCDISFEKPVRFEKFLNEMFEGNENLINYVHKALGYSISNSTREQCLFILYGDGNSGKSLLMDLIRDVLGSYAISTRPQLLTEQRNGNSNLEEIARLKGKRFIAVEEMKASDKFDESLVKSLTSGIGNQVARFLYGNSFEFPVTGKIWNATNYEPSVRGTDRGIWRRIKVIPVNVDFSGREDKDLKYKLLEEKSQILGWLIEGYRLYQEEGLVEPDEVKSAIKSYKESNDAIQQWINEYCEVGEDYFEQATTLFENFDLYTKKFNLGKYSQTLFGRNMGKKNFTKKPYGGKIVYFGLKIKKDYQDITKKAMFDSIRIDDDI